MGTGGRGDQVFGCSCFVSWTLVRGTNVSWAEFMRIDAADLCVEVLRGGCGCVWFLFTDSLYVGL